MSLHVANRIDAVELLASVLAAVFVMCTVERREGEATAVHSIGQREFSVVTRFFLRQVMTRLLRISYTIHLAVDLHFSVDSRNFNFAKRIQ